MAARHPFELIQEMSQGLDPGALGTGYGKAISDKLNAGGFAHTFDGLDRYKFSDPSMVDTRFGTIDAIKNQGFVQGRRGPSEQSIVFQPWHDRKEARAMGLMPDGGQGQAMRQLHSPVFGAQFPGQGVGSQALQDLFDPQGQSRSMQPMDGGATMPAPIDISRPAQPTQAQGQPPMRAMHRRPMAGGY